MAGFTHGLDRSGALILHMVGHLGGGQHDVVSVADQLIGVLVAIDSEVVGQGHSSEAPLAAQNILHQRSIGGHVGVAEVVEGGHGGLCATIDHCSLEGLQVDLADGLLVGPGGQHVVTVGLLVVHGEVLHEGVDTLGAGTGDLVGSHDGVDLRVLREVLEVTAGEGAAVDVEGRCVPAGHIHVVGHGADHLAEAGGQLGVPGAGQGGG